MNKLSSNCCYIGKMGKIFSKSRNNESKKSDHVEDYSQEILANEINREPLSAMTFIGDNLYCGDQTGVISKFNVANGNMLDSLKVHTKAITQVQSVYNQHMFTSSRDKNICKRLVDSSSSNDDVTMTGHRLAATGLAVKPDGLKILSGGRDCAVVLWDSSTGVEENRLEVARNIVTDISWIGNETQVIQCSEDKIMKVLDTRLMVVAETFPIKQYFQSCCDVNNDGVQVVTGSVGGNGNGCNISIWDIRQRMEMTTMMGHKQNVNRVQYFITTTGQTRIVSISSDCFVRIWDPVKEVCTCSLYISGGQSLTCMTCLQNDVLIVGTLHGSIYKLQYDISKEELNQICIF